MKFEIKFDENIFKKQIELTFNRSWSKSKTENKKLAIIAFIFILLGIIILCGNGDIGNLFIILGILAGIVFLYRLQKYLKAKKATENIMIENIQIWNNNPISIWEFEDDFFRFKFYGGDYKINWETVKYSEVVDNTLFFGFKENGSYYTLSESEIGKAEFLKVVEFVERKIEPATNTRF
ncbi:hypothetical protein AB3G33_11180 [Flavobacterium sp. WC2421]|uniref:hypothetical protein n=1 Tax=Flavobacterium sp. WC2421 TaxID=3234138 RepID=UPI0034658015